MNEKDLKNYILPFFLTRIMLTPLIGILKTRWISRFILRFSHLQFSLQKTRIKL